MNILTLPGFCARCCPASNLSALMRHQTFPVGASLFTLQRKQRSGSLTELDLSQNPVPSGHDDGRKTLPHPSAFAKVPLAGVTLLAVSSWMATNRLPKWGWVLAGIYVLG